MDKGIEGSFNNDTILSTYLIGIVIAFLTLVGVSNAGILTLLYIDADKFNL